mgnify:CR=1 FL=1
MKTTKTAKEKLAGLVRVISIPPVMVTALLLILYFWGPQPFCPVGELVTTILLLVLFAFIFLLLFFNPLTV